MRTGHTTRLPGPLRLLAHREGLSLCTRAPGHSGPPLLDVARVPPQEPPGGNRSRACHRPYAAHRWSLAPIARKPRAVPSHPSTSAPTSSTRSGPRSIAASSRDPSSLSSKSRSSRLAPTNRLPRRCEADRGHASRTHHRHAGRCVQLPRKGPHLILRAVSRLEREPERSPSLPPDCPPCRYRGSKGCSTVLIKGSSGVPSTSSVFSQQVASIAPLQ